MLAGNSAIESMGGPVLGISIIFQLVILSVC